MRKKRGVGNSHGSRPCVDNLAAVTPTTPTPTSANEYRSRHPLRQFHNHNTLSFLFCACGCFPAWILLFLPVYSQAEYMGAIGKVCGQSVKKHYESVRFLNAEWDWKGASGKPNFCGGLVGASHDSFAFLPIQILHFHPFPLSLPTARPATILAHPSSPIYPMSLLNTPQRYPGCSRWC